MASFSFQKFKDMIIGPDQEPIVDPISDDDNGFGDCYGRDIYGGYNAGGTSYRQEPEESSYNNSFNEVNIEQAPVEEDYSRVTTPVYKQPATTVVMLSPFDIKSSQTVADHIREGHIVICNLSASANNQRVVDYISGAVYAFDGKIEPTAVKTTFVCTPSNVNLIVDGDDDATTRVSSL